MCIRDRVIVAAVPVGWFVVAFAWPASDGGVGVPEQAAVNATATANRTEVR